MSENVTNRRLFLKQSAVVALSLPLFVNTRVYGANDRIHMGFIGMVNVQGPFPPVFEMQARWVSRVFSGQQALPSAQDMKHTIADDQTRRKIRGARPTLVQYYPYLEEIAQEIGVRPRW